MSRTIKNRSLEYYLSLDYPLEVTRCEGGYVVEYIDLPGCIAQGKTEEEAVARLKEGREAWFRVTLELGLPIPLPHSSLPEVEIEKPLPKWTIDFEMPRVDYGNIQCEAAPA